MLPISRRHLLGLLAGFLAPASRADDPSGLDTTSQMEIGPSAFSAIRQDSDSSHPSALEVWRRLAMRPLVDFKSFSSVAQSDREQFLGRMILGRMGSQTHFEFGYLGGSEPGSTRRVQPILLFRKFEMACDPTIPPPIYLLAFCHTRQQARTFRLDRISSL